MHSRGGGIHGNTVAATTHLGTVTEGLSGILTNLPQGSLTHPREGGLGENCKACKQMC